MALEGFLGLNRALAGGYYEVQAIFSHFCPVLGHFKAKIGHFRAFWLKRAKIGYELAVEKVATKGTPLVAHFWAIFG